jgi:DNA-binding protein H-NS
VSQHILADWLYLKYERHRQPALCDINPVLMLLVLLHAHQPIGGISMAKLNLSSMDFQSLVNLRQQVDERLHDHRATLEKQLALLGGSMASPGRGKVSRGGLGSALKGTKVAPKYRGPSGETWAGRGAKPRWLVAAIKGGRKLENFLIDKSTANGRKKPKSKR